MWRVVVCGRPWNVKGRGVWEALLCGGSWCVKGSSVGRFVVCVNLRIMVGC